MNDANFLKCMWEVVLVKFISNVYRWRNLKEALLENRSKLGEAQTMQQFSRDVDELEIWISEKLQMAMEESYKDPSNIQVGKNLI